MRILVLGAGKTGTTAVVHCIRQSALASGYILARLYEPRCSAVIEERVGQKSAILAKVLLERHIRFESRSYTNLFDKRILMVRDPRDTVVSRYIWMVATRVNDADEATRRSVLASFEQKQRLPESISLIELMRIARPLVGNYNFEDVARRIAYLANGMADELDAIVLRYEDFVDRNLATIGSYLGFDLLLDFELGKQGHVKRSAAYGAWKNWFTEDDVRFFATERAADLVALGYDPAIMPFGTKRIPFEDTLGYVQRLRSRFPGASANAAPG